MACNIIRGSDGTNTVVDANGNPSALYDDLLQLLSNYPYATSELIPTDDINNLALQYYELSNTPEFRSKYNLTSKLDVEVSIDDIISHINTEYSFNETQEQGVKEGVEELFESTPELANSVYESLGFGKKIDSNISINELEDTDISKEIDILYKGESIGKATLVKSENSDDVDYIEDWSIKSEYQNKGLGYSARQILQNKYPTLKLSSAATDKSKYLYEKAIKNQITPQQKQQAQQLYSNFLSNFVDNNFDTIIQDLQTKNILDKKCS